MIFSCCIPAKDSEDPNLKRLLASIRKQDFPQGEIETIVVTDGNSEEAKGKAIRMAKGEIVVMFCTDNEIVNPNLFSSVYQAFAGNPYLTGVYSKHYAHLTGDFSLNRYFSLIGCNDPVMLYLGKSDRKPYFYFDNEEVLSIRRYLSSVPSFGDNGFFFNREHLLEADIDHFYPMDVCEDLRKKGFYFYGRMNNRFLWHKTTDNNLIKFLARRFFYADTLFCQKISERRWRAVSWRDFKAIAFFVGCSLTILQPLAVSVYGFIKKRDIAWFWHPIVMLGFTLMYGGLTIKWLIKSVLSSLHWGGKKV